MEDGEDSQRQLSRLIPSTRVRKQADAPASLHFIIYWWNAYGKRMDIRQATSELLKKLDEEVGKNATPSERDSEGHTVLHLSVILMLPSQFVVALIRLLDPTVVNQRDNRERTALDYFLDQDPELTDSGVFQAFVNGRADFTGGQECFTHNCPLARLCRRLRDGHSLLSYLIPEQLQKTTWEISKNSMLEEAVKCGSHTTVKVGDFQRCRAALVMHRLYFASCCLKTEQIQTLRASI
jgi:hypothetical protein